MSQAFEGGDLKEKELREETFSHELELCSARALHGLMTLVHDHVSVSDQTGALQSSSTNGSADGEESMNFTSLNSLENDQVAISIWNLEPCVLQKVLLTMAVSSFHFSVTFTRLKLFFVEGMEEISLFQLLSSLINKLRLLNIVIDA